MCAQFKDENGSRAEEQNENADDIDIMPHELEINDAVELSIKLKRYKELLRTHEISSCIHSLIDEDKRMKTAVDNLSILFDTAKGSNETIMYKENPYKIKPLNVDNRDQIFRGIDQKFVVGRKFQTCKQVDFKIQIKKNAVKIMCEKKDVRWRKEHEKRRENPVFGGDRGNESKSMEGYIEKRGIKQMKKGMKTVKKNTNISSIENSGRKSYAWAGNKSKLRYRNQHKNIVQQRDDTFSQQKSFSRSITTTENRSERHVDTGLRNQNTSNNAVQVRDRAMRDTQSKKENHFFRPMQNCSRASLKPKSSPHRYHTDIHTASVSVLGSSKDMKQSSIQDRIKRFEKQAPTKETKKSIETKSTIGDMIAAFDRGKTSVKVSTQTEKRKALRDRISIFEIQQLKKKVSCGNFTKSMDFRSQLVPKTCSTGKIDYRKKFEPSALKNDPSKRGRVRRKVSALIEKLEVNSPPSNYTARSKSRFHKASYVSSNVKAC